MKNCLNKICKTKTKRGLSLIEIVLAVAIFAVFAVGVSGLVIQALHQNQLGGDQTIATQYASEGLEAMRSIRNQAFTNLAVNPATGLTQAGGVWALNGTSNTFDGGKYTRVIAIQAVQRDGSGNIVASGGTIDSNTYKIISTVNWNFNSTRQDSVILSTYLTGYGLAVTPNKKNGILVYGAGGTTNDSIKYKIFDANTNTWSSELSAGDIDSGSTNKALRVAKIYSSVSRNEKVLISRHFDGTNQFIYGQIFNGTTWNTPQLLSTLNVNTFLDVQNFDGSYLANGDFVAVFSDNSTTPKMRVWNGTAWGSQISTQNVGGIPNYIITNQRPSTNELMVITFDQLSDTNSEYFNGGSYITGNWALHTEHSATAPLNTKKIIDFSWNGNDTTKGILIFSNNANDRNIRYKLFTANGTGGGAWGNTTNGANQGTTSTRSGVLEIVNSPNTTNFVACDQNTVPQVICYGVNTSMAITNPTNQIFAPIVDTGIQQTFSMGFEMQSASNAIVVYSDATITPKLKKYSPTTNTFDLSATNITNLIGTLKTVRVIPQSSTNDMIITLADSNRTLYTVFWDGTNHQLYNSTDALGFNTHGNNGSAPTDYWYDFAWDN